MIRAHLKAWDSAVREDRWIIVSPNWRQCQLKIPHTSYLRLDLISQWGKALVVDVHTSLNQRVWGVWVNKIAHSLDRRVFSVTQPTHVPFFSSFDQWLKKSTKVNPAQIAKRNLRWRHPPHTDPLPWLWKKNSEKSERAPGKGLLLWAKPIDKCPLLASSRGSELLSLLGQRQGVVREKTRHTDSHLLCKFI